MSQPCSLCSLRPMPARRFADRVTARRARLILLADKKWVSGTILRYTFLDGVLDRGAGHARRVGRARPRDPARRSMEPEQDIVRRAFDAWRRLDIGVEFEEVGPFDRPEVRIGFVEGDGAWSYIGRDVLTAPAEERTMNFGWSLALDPRGLDTAMHEIGHTLGFPHEHQNPKAGIVWNEDAVYALLALPPNSWDRETTYHNILEKLAPDAIQGSRWDPDSVMHYAFPAGLIREPAKYRKGLVPRGGLSKRDVRWVRAFYPRLRTRVGRALVPLRLVRLAVPNGGQQSFTITPAETRVHHVRSFGRSDAVMVLFEERSGGLVPRAADDDSGEERNAEVSARLVRGKRYVLRVRVYHAARPLETAVMLW